MSKVKKIIAAVLAILIAALLAVGNIILLAHLWKAGWWFLAVIQFITVIFAAEPAFKLVKALASTALPEEILTEK